MTGEGLGSGGTRARSSTRPGPRSVRADAAEAMRTASRRVAEAEARAAALSGDVDALTAELRERPTPQDATWVARRAGTRAAPAAARGSRGGCARAQ